MVIRTSADVFDADTSIGDVLGLMSAIADGPHEWSPALDIDAIADYLRMNVPRQAESLIALAREGFTAAAYRPPNEAEVKIGPADLHDTVEDLRQPALVVVEDSVSDAKFITALAQIFGPQKIRDALERGWLKPRHAGGSGRIVAVTAQCVAEFNTVVRVFVLLDSDRLYPGHRTKNHDIHDQVIAMGVPCHTLEMREAENYVPTKALAVVRGLPVRQSVLARRLDALKTLQPEQRGYYDIKKGFKLENGAVVIPPDQEELFAGVPETTRKQLVGGFGDSVLAQLEVIQLSRKPKDFTAIGPNVVPEIESLLTELEVIV